LIDSSNLSSCPIAPTCSMLVWAMMQSPIIQSDKKSNMGQ
jgi:hypothetical protein